MLTGAGDRWDRVASTTGLGTVLLAAIAVEALAIAQTWGGAYWIPGSAAALVVSLLALLRQRRPVWTAVAGIIVAALAIVAARLADLPAAPGPAPALGLAVLIGSVIRTVPPVQAGAVAGAGIVVVACGQLARPEPAGITAVTALGGALWAAGVVAGLALRRLDGRARDTAEAIRRTERLDLARELHDVVAHHITGMLIQAQAAQVLARRDPAKVAGSLGDIEAAGSDALAAMRRVVGLLRDDDAAPPSTDQEDLAELVERFGRQGPEVRLRVPGDEAAWPPEVTSTVYRIVQEALTNVLRHAPRARSVAVTVGRDPHGFTVEVADDAPPVSARAQHRGGYGLIGMRERVVALGGTLGAGPRPGSGWSVRATLPVPPGEPR